MKKIGLLILPLLICSPAYAQMEPEQYKNTEPHVMSFDAGDEDEKLTDKDIADAATQACVRVWIDPKHHTYHIKQSTLYGQTPNGRTMCLNVAKILHYKMAKIKKPKKGNGSVISNIQNGE